MFDGTMLGCAFIYIIIIVNNKSFIRKTNIMFYWKLGKAFFEKFQIYIFQTHNHIYLNYV